MSCLSFNDVTLRGKIDYLLFTDSGVIIKIRAILIKNKDRREGNVTGAYKKKVGTKYYIDMGAVKADDTFLHANAAARRKHRELKRLDPFSKVIGGKRKYENPKDLKRQCDKYFQSLMRPVYIKGQMMKDEAGNPIMEQIRPATISGLAQFLGIQTKTLKSYHMKSVSGLIPPEYAEIVLEARQKIEVFAEEQMYSRDGARGAQFVLQAGFGWQTKGEQSEQRMNKQRIKAMKQELKLKQKMLDEAEKTEDTELKVKIIRAGLKTGDE